MFLSLCFLFSSDSDLRLSTAETGKEKRRVIADANYDVGVELLV